MPDYSPNSSRKNSGCRYMRLLFNVSSLVIARPPRAVYCNAQAHQETARRETISRIAASWAKNLQMLPTLLYPR